MIYFLLHVIGQNETPKLIFIEILMGTKKISLLGIGHMFCRKIGINGKTTPRLN